MNHSFKKRLRISLLILLGLTSCSSNTTASTNQSETSMTSQESSAVSDNEQVDTSESLESRLIGRWEDIENGSLKLYILDPDEDAAYTIMEFGELEDDDIFPFLTGKYEIVDDQLVIDPEINIELDSNSEYGLYNHPEKHLRYILTDSAEKALDDEKYFYISPDNNYLIFKKSEFQSF